MHAFTLVFMLSGTNTKLCSVTAEVRFIEKLNPNLMAVQKHHVVLETLVENPHKRAVSWSKDGKPITDNRYQIKGGLVLDMVDR